MAIRKECAAQGDKPDNKHVVPIRPIIPDNLSLHVASQQEEDPNLLIDIKIGFPWLSSMQAKALIRYRVELEEGPKKEGDMSRREFCLIFPDITDEDAKEFALRRRIKFAIDRQAINGQRYSQSLDRGMKFIPLPRAHEEDEPLRSFVSDVYAFSVKYKDGGELFAAREGLVKPRGKVSKH